VKIINEIEQESFEKRIKFYLVTEIQLVIAECRHFIFLNIHRLFIILCTINHYINIYVRSWENIFIDKNTENVFKELDNWIKSKYINIIFYFNSMTFLELSILYNGLTLLAVYKELHIYPKEVIDLLAQKTWKLIKFCKM